MKLDKGDSDHNNSDGGDWQWRDDWATMNVKKKMKINKNVTFYR